MFQVKDRSTRRVTTVFGVHKSGPHDDQTKFLVHDGEGWRWQWASRFEPLQAQRPTLTIPRDHLTPAVA